MTTLTVNYTLCVDNKLHTPHNESISVVATSFDDADYYTFCEVCEQNIQCFSFYDDDCGVRYSKWAVSH